MAIRVLPATNIYKGDHYRTLYSRLIIKSVKYVPPFYAIGIEERDSNHTLKVLFSDIQSPEFRRFERSGNGDIQISLFNYRAYFHSEFDIAVDFTYVGYDEELQCEVYSLMLHTP